MLLLLPLYFSCCIHFDRCGILKFAFACEIHLKTIFFGAQET